ncbi:hypothetical protein ACP275_10G132800 [Erythranthe tilingii]
MRPSYIPGHGNYARKPYPPGYRFAPKDIELIVDYLRKRIRHEHIPVPEISDVNLYLANPQTLGAIYPKLGENEWYYFTPRDRKYKNGSRPSRSAGTGYWKATGSDKSIHSSDGKIAGYKKSLVFYEGKPPAGTKTNWIMHEYRSNEPSRARPRTDKLDMRLDDFVLCRVYEKMGEPADNPVKQKSNARRANKEAVAQEVVVEEANDNKDEQPQPEEVAASDLRGDNTSHDAAAALNEDDRFDSELYIAKFDVSSEEYQFPEFELVFSDDLDLYLDWQLPNSPDFNSQQVPCHDIYDGSRFYSFDCDLRSTFNRSMPNKRNLDSMQNNGIPESMQNNGNPGSMQNNWNPGSMQNNGIPESMQNNGNPGIMQNNWNPGSMQNNGIPESMQNNGNPGIMQNNWSPGSMQNNGIPESMQNNGNPGIMQNNWNPGSMQNNWNPGSMQNNWNPGSMQNNWNQGSMQNIPNPGSMQNIPNPGSMQNIQNPGSKQNPYYMPNDHRAVSATYHFRQHQGHNFGMHAQNTGNFAPQLPNIYGENVEGKNIQHGHSSSRGNNFVPPPGVGSTTYNTDYHPRKKARYNSGLELR